MSSALYVKGKVDFKQPEHGQGGTSSAKNKSKVGFQQPSHGKGKNKSGMMNVKGKVGFDQPSHGKGGTSSKKNPGKVGFQQPNPAKKSVGTGVSVKGYTGAKMGKAKGAPKVAPKMKSMDDVLAYRKKTYGV